MKSILVNSLIFFSLVRSIFTVSHFAQKQPKATLEYELRFVPNQTFGLSPEEEISFASEAAAKIAAFHDYHKTIVNNTLNESERARALDLAIGLFKDENQTVQIGTTTGARLNFKVRAYFDRLKQRSTSTYQKVSIDFEPVVVSDNFQQQGDEYVGYFEIVQYFRGIGTVSYCDKTVKVAKVYANPNKAEVVRLGDITVASVEALACTKGTSVGGSKIEEYPNTSKRQLPSIASSYPNAQVRLKASNGVKLANLTMRDFADRVKYGQYEGFTIKSSNSSQVEIEVPITKIGNK